MAQRSDVMLGDIGTVYQVPCYDNDIALANFDPTSATTKQLIFKMPGAGSIVRTATAAQVTIGGVSTWCLTYTVVAADVVAYTSPSVGGFHQAAGDVSLQGYLEFNADQHWHSSPVTTDQQGRRLGVRENL
jgi:hypothetical protein